MEFIDLKKQYQIIENNIKIRFSDILNDARFIMGQEIWELEKKLADYVGVSHCISCSSGTDALLLPMLAFGIGAGDAVFVPSFTFFASAEVIASVGATPIFVDVKEDTFNIDSEKLEEAILAAKTEGKYKLKAVIAVDIFGLPAEYQKIESIAKKYKLKLIEDGAQGFGGYIKNFQSEKGAGEIRRACSFGDVAATSFFPAKPLGCYGDGGAVFTNDDDLADIMKSIRIHGQGSERYENVRIGINGRLDTLQAAVLLEKLKIFDAELTARKNVAEIYNKGLAKILKVPQTQEDYFSCFAQYTIKTKDESERQMLMEDLKLVGVPTAIYYPIPVHKQKAFIKLNCRYCDLSVSEYLSERVFSIPMHPYLIDEETEKIVATIRNGIKRKTFF